MLSASKPKCNFGHWSKMTILSHLHISYLPKLSGVLLTIVLLWESVLLNFGKRYDHSLRVLILGQTKPPLLCGREEDTEEDLFCCEEKTSVKNEPTDKRYG